MARKAAYRDISQTLSAADKWIKSALVEDSSIFSSTALWTKELVEELHEAFVEHPDNGGDSFMTKLKRQIGAASPSSQQLMGEMFWALLLFPSNVGSDTKRRQIREIWALSGQPLDENHPFLTDDILRGIGSGGTAFNNLRPLEMEYLIVLTRDLKLKDIAERQRIFSDYDQFIGWIDTVPRKGDRQFRHMLRFFAFPDRVERMSSNQDRISILEAFEVAPRREIKKWTDRQLDDALFKLRSDLEKDAPSQILDFYDAPWKERWKLEPPSSGTETQEAQSESVATSNTASDDNLAQNSTPPAASSYSTANIIDEGGFVEKEHLDRYLERLKVKKNLILQGPPGTGKTWLATRLAYALLGTNQRKVTGQRLRTVQFHPSLSYEDFVRGWRPDGSGKLALVDGPFLEMVSAAGADLDRPYVLIIEEINRGNPAQVFGEMLTLLEDTKRQKEDAIELAYRREQDERIHIPPNLHVIGTMNIADRSLALVDLALRRRFAFITLEPALNTLWRRWCVDRCGFSEDVVTAISDRMAALNVEIAGDRALGAQFQIGHSYATPPQIPRITDALSWFRSVIETEIVPILEEYWFDSPDKVNAAKTILLTGL